MRRVILIWHAPGRLVRDKRQEQRKSLCWYDALEDRVVPPPAVLRERDHRRDLYANQDVRGALLGDPLPGYSALDRRRSK